MSTLLDCQFPCPGCGTTIAGEVVFVANTSTHSHLRPPILDRTLNTFTCSSCAQGTLVERTVAVLDFERRQWLVCYPEWAEQHWLDLARVVRSGFHRNMGLAAPRFLRDEMDQWQVRVVFGYEALREKLIIADAGLDDAAIELRKPMLLTQEPVRGLSRMFLDEVAENALWWRVYSGQDRMYKLATTRDLSALSLPPPGLSPALELRADPFVSYRRWLLRPIPADPEIFDLDHETAGYEHESSTAFGWKHRDQARSHQNLASPDPDQPETALLSQATPR